MNKMRVALLTLPALVVLFITACGLEGDLYMPSEESAAAPAGAQTAGQQSPAAAGTGNSGAEISDADIPVTDEETADLPSAP